MGTWSKDELLKIAEADDLHIAPFREDGVTYGTPTWIWSVAVGDALYVRGYSGQKSRWYQAARMYRVGFCARGSSRSELAVPIGGGDSAIHEDVEGRHAAWARTRTRAGRRHLSRREWRW